MVALDESRDARRAAFRSCHRGAATRVIEIQGKRAAATSETGSQPRYERIDKDRQDPVPNSRGFWLRAVVEETREDELVVGAPRSQDLCRPFGVTLIPPRYRDISPRLHDAVDHAQNAPPTRNSTIARAGRKTIVLMTLGASSRTNSSRNGPYCWNVRHEYCCRGGRRP